ncbi:MAG: protein of unknown function domain protein [Acidimicrobiaceae bacterium]|nr:protein of unknown function domain protein [Acidimicrobiaceae bacterium]
MSMFPAISIAGTGIEVDSTWIDTVGGNVANAQDTVTPGRPVYREQSVEAQPAAQTAGPFAANAPLGVQVAGITLGSAKGVTVSDPSNPVANASGLVTQPDVSISHEMVSLVEAQTNYQANVNVLQSSDNAYKAILNIKA